MNYYHQLVNIKTSIRGKKANATNWNDIQLISIHIPKTAGTSFIHTLKKQYNDHKVVRIDINRGGIVRANKIPVKEAYVYKNPTVIHGHFTIGALKKQFDLPSNIPIITWLRDPVERVISNYYYLSKRLDEELNETKKGLNILSKMRKTLLEYAQNEINQNRISKFLEGVEIQDLFFVGIVENFDEDIQLLAKKLDWEKVEIVEHNRTGKKHKRQVDEKTKALIRSYNQKDYEIYKKALELRTGE